MRQQKYLLLFLPLLLFACSQDQQQEKESQEDQQNYVTATKVSKESFSRDITTAATVYASKEANVGATVPGKLEKLLVDKGDRVKEGQLMALMSGELLTQAQVEYDALKKDYNRVKRLHENGSVTDQRLDHVKAEYDAAKAKVDMLKENTEIRAPFSGVVTDFLLEEGENFSFNPNLKAGYSKTSGIIQLMRLNPVEVSFNVNEKELPHIHKGQEVEVMLTSFPDTILHGRITGMPKMLSTSSRSGEVVAQLANPGQMILPGMSAKVTVKGDEASAVFVPLEAVARQQETNTDYVFKVENKKVKKAEVNRIATIRGKIAVTGLREGETVVVSGKGGLENGDKVVVKNR